MYFITLINKMTDEEVKNLKCDFSWITLLDPLAQMDIPRIMKSNCDALQQKVP